MKSKASDDICTACSLSVSLPPLIWCVDCGEIVEIGEFDNETCRCEKHRKEHKAALNRERQKRWYDKHKT
jgi:hypothetical protein|nr:MAG TPA: CXCXC repeat protein [Caudoviricetes sp.]